jgi:hypothetical protein
MKKSKATEHRSEYRTSKGSKRYLKRNAKGRIVDNQSFKNAHGQDVRKSSKAERAK